MTSMLEIEYDDSALLESLVEDIREFTDWMEVSEGKGEYSIRKVHARNDSVSIVLKDQFRIPSVQSGST